MQALQVIDHKYNNAYLDCWGHTHLADAGSVIMPRAGMYVALTIKDKILLKFPDPNSTIAELVGDTLEERETPMDTMRRVVEDATDFDCSGHKITSKHMDSIPYYSHTTQEYWEYDMLFVRVDLSDHEDLLFQGTKIMDDGSRLAWRPIVELYDVALNYVHSMAFRTLLIN